jgi:hypothetical protein
MNTMIYYAFNFFILSIGIFVVGMIKPKWILFWMDKPYRLAVTLIAAPLLMVSLVMYGEGNKQLQQEKEKLAKTQAITQAAEVPVPVATPAAVPAAAADVSAKP